MREAEAFCKFAKQMNKRAPKHKGREGGREGDKKESRKVGEDEEVMKKQMNK